MIHFILSIFFSATSFAQAPAAPSSPVATYSPALYQEQTRHCPFIKLIPRPTTQLQELIQQKDSDLRHRYPLSSPWIQQDAFLEKLGQALYKNEANCELQNLTHWNSKEPFPSLGLPHAIWYPQLLTDKKYQEQFPELIRFIHKNLKKHETVKITWPSILLKEPLGTAPWADQKEFAQLQALSLKIADTQNAYELIQLKDKNPSLYPRAYELFTLRHFLANPIVLKLQARYVMDKTFLTLHRILAAVEKSSPQDTQRFYILMQSLLSSQEGVLALIDYLNFKGDGLKPSEKTEISGFYWGLLTVLDLANQPYFLSTPPSPTSHATSPGPLSTGCSEKDANDCALQRFAEAALCSLQRLAFEAGPLNSEIQKQKYLWLNGGWKTRIDSNYRPHTFSTNRCEKPAPAAGV